MQTAMQKYLSFKAALLEPSTLGHQTILMASTANWLVKLATGSIDNLPTGQIAEAESPATLVSQSL
jgi:hypothetical protein